MFSLAPSLMCADLLQLGHEVRELERAGVEFFHLDVMDGHFVPNLGLNFDLIRQVKSFTSVPIDVHLMVDTPEDYVQIIGDLKIPYVSFHIEATCNPIRLARAMKAVGAKVGIALNPSTPVGALQYMLHEIDYVLAMTVEPGFTGQRFIASMFDKVDTIRKALEKVRPGIPIEVDGNLDIETSSRCIERGATILVGGTSSIFRREHGLHSDCITFRKKVEQLSEQSKRSMPA
jgi:ribulose-phosphate 3-epimerase